MSNNVLAWVLLIVLGLIWGSSFILIKRGLIGLTPYELGSIRVLTASLFLLPFSFNRLKKIKKKDMMYVFSVGLLGSLIPAFLFSLAQTNLNSSISGALNGFTPVFTVLVGIFLFQEKHPKKDFIGIFISLLGVLFLALSKEITQIHQLISDFNSYALLVVLATFCYGMNINVIKHRLQNINAITISGVSLLYAGFVAFCYLIFFSDFFTISIYQEKTQTALVYASILGCVGTGFALALFMNLVKISSPLFASSVTYIIPVVAIIWGLIDQEVILLTHYYGIICIGIGVYLINAKKRR